MTGCNTAMIYLSIPWSHSACVVYCRLCVRGNGPVWCGSDWGWPTFHQAGPQRRGVAGTENVGTGHGNAGTGLWRCVAEMESLCVVVVICVFVGIQIEWKECTCLNVFIRIYKRTKQGQNNVHIFSRGTVISQENCENLIIFPWSVVKVSPRSSAGVICMQEDDVRRKMIKKKSMYVRGSVQCSKSRGPQQRSSYNQATYKRLMDQVLKNHCSLKQSLCFSLLLLSTWRRHSIVETVVYFLSLRSSSSPISEYVFSVLFHSLCLFLCCIVLIWPPRLTGR